MQKITKTSHLLYRLFQVLSWFLPLITVYLFLFKFEMLQSIGFWSHSIALNYQIHDMANFSFIHKMLILAIECIPLSITVLICHKLSKLFHLFEQGSLFEEENIRLIKQISICMILSEMLQLIYQPLATLALSFNNPAGERFISLTFGSTNLSTLITGFIILVASWIMQEAQQLKSETLLTI